MEFRFNEEQDKLRQDVHEFCAREPWGALEDSKIVGHHSPSLYRKMVNKGWLGLPFPKKYGGQGLSLVEQTIWEEEVAHSGVPIALNVIGSTINLFGQTILNHGTEEQKKEYLSKISRGEIWVGQAFTEPEAGCDLLQIQTCAIRDGSNYIINGQKMFSTSGGRTHHFPKQYSLLMAKTDPNTTPEEGISLFILDIDLPGYSLTPLSRMDGGLTYQVYLDNVRVPKECLIGRENAGWEYYMKCAMCFCWDRGPGYYCGSIGRVLDQIINYVKEMPSLRGDTLVRNKLAEMAIRLKILRLQSYHLAWAWSKGLNAEANKMASIIKCFRDRVLHMEMPNIGMDILGLYGQLRRDSKFAPLQGLIEYWSRRQYYYTFAYEGFGFAKNFIANELLGLPGNL